MKRSRPKMSDRRKRVLRIAAIIGTLAGAACHFVPPEYQAACGALTKAATLSAGGC